MFDTNLYLTFLLSHNPIGTKVDVLFDAAASQKLDLLLPIGVIVELNSVAERPRMAQRISHRQIELLLRRVSEFATVLPLMEARHPRVCRDPDDDYLLALAFSYEADFMVTRDLDLLELGSVLNVCIVDPVAFLGVVRALSTNDE